MNKRGKTAHRRRLWRYGLLTIAVMAFIFWMSAKDGKESGDLSHTFLGTLVGRMIEALIPASWGLTPDHVIRKGAHMFEFCCLSICSFLFLRELWGRILRSGGAGWLWSVLYAATDEWHQTFVPGRAGQFQDVLIDACGALIGALLAMGAAGLSCKKREGQLRNGFRN